MPNAPPPGALERAVLAGSITLVAGSAWLALWLAGGAGFGLAHHGPASAHQVTAWAPLLFIGGWAAMAVAMMLPTSLPLLAACHAVAAGRRDRFFLVGLVAAGYLGVWTAFGALVYLAAWSLERMLPAIPAARAYSQAGAPLLLLVAGAFQFSSLKRRCLDKCGSAMACVTGHWRERPNPWLAFRLGLRGGIFCVGCCWAVMLLMFLAGAGSLGWMLVLAAFMGIEKNLPLGRRMSAPAGIVLLIAGAALMAARFA